MPGPIDPPPHPTADHVGPGVTAGFAPHAAFLNGFAGDIADVRPLTATLKAKNGNGNTYLQGLAGSVTAFCHCHSTLKAPLLLPFPVSGGFSQR